MACEFKIVRRVEFAETDLAGIMHYSNYFRFMETAEHGFFRSLGFSIVTRHVEPPVGWPRVHAECDFKLPLHFEDEVEVRLIVTGKRSKSLNYEFRFTKLNAQPPIEVARGRLTVVCVTHHSSGKMSACTIPREIADRIDVAPEEVLSQ
jgi:acyl-CoA thioester hydrolase